MKARINRIGQVYGSWTILSMTVNRKVKARCICGTEKEIYVGALLIGKSNSCGCQRKNRYKHGGTHTRLYGVWQAIKRRCYMKTIADYKNYGGRGIRMADEWINEFEPFRKWSLENGYKKGLEIDRTNNDGNYEPSNCKWVTHTVNGNNKRNSKFATINGKTQTISQWATESGISRKTIQSRLNYGWEDERLLLSPKLGNNQFTTYGGLN